jgi:hypothetical protein
MKHIFAAAIAFYLRLIRKVLLLMGTPLEASEYLVRARLVIPCSQIKT